MNLRCFVLLISSFAVSIVSFSQSRDLNYYLSKGIQNSPLLNDYTNQLQEQKIDSLLVLAGRKITVSGTGEILIAPIINEIGYDEAITNEGQYTATIGVSKTFFQHGSTAAQINQGKIRSDSILTTKLVSQRELEKSITDQYLSSYHALSQIQFEEQNVAALENQLGLLEPLVRSGIYLQTDYLTLQLKIQTEKIHLQQLKDDYRSNLYTLNALCGIADTSTLEITKPELTWKTTQYDVNPNLNLFSLDSSAAEATKNVLRYNYVPKVSVFGDAGYNAIPADFSVKKFGFSGGVAVGWNFADGNQKNLRIQQLSIRQKTSSFYRKNYSLQLQLQLADLDKKFQNIGSVITQLQSQLTQMNTLLSLRRQQLLSGQLSIIDYLSLIRDYHDLQINLSETLFTQQQIINQHNYLVW